MIKANIEAAIKEKEEERNYILAQLSILDDMIEQIKITKRHLLDDDTDLIYEIEELKEQL